MAVEEAAELVGYLPLSFKSPKEQEYIAFLWDAFETNYVYEKYQFAFLAYHMLVMSFIYFEIWQIKQVRVGDFEIAMVGFNKDMERDLLSATTPFAFWRVKESSVLRFLKLVGCDNGEVGTYAALVKERNEAAHPNGHIFFSTRAALDLKISEMLRAVDEIQAHSKPVVDHCYREFLLHSQDSEEREYVDDADHIREVLVHGNYLSQRDVDVCLAFDIDVLRDEKGFESIRSLHETLLRDYAAEGLLGEAA